MAVNILDIKVHFNRLRLYTILSIIVYILVCDWIYISWLSPNFGYYGYEYNVPSKFLLLSTHLFAILPSFWISVKLTRPTISIYWFIYLLLYIPSQLFPAFIHLSSDFELFVLSLTFFISFEIIGFSYLFKTKSLKPIIVLTNTQFSYFLYGTSLFLILYLILIYGGNLQLVGYQDIYTFRQENSGKSEGSMAGYAILALGSSILPVMMAFGLLNKTTKLVIFSIIGQIFLFSTQGAKSNLLAPVILYFVYFIVYKGVNKFGIILVKSIAIFIGMLNVIAISFTIDNYGILFYAISEIYVRTISMEGLLTAQYYQFFLNNPYTYYTHINIIGKLFTYPYGTESIGKVIGYEYTGNELVNSNANFLLTDGIAAFGLTGVILISIMCSMVFYLVDFISEGLDVRYTSVALAFITLNLLNSSLFSTLLSGGLLFTMFLFYLTPKQSKNL